MADEKIKYMLCYDTVVGQVNGKETRRKGKQPVFDSFAPGFGDPVHAIIQSAFMESIYGKGSHWIEDPDGKLVNPDDYKMQISAHQTASAVTLGLIFEGNPEP
jgi:hypothetical protein